MLPRIVLVPEGLTLAPALKAQLVRRRIEVTTEIPEPGTPVTLVVCSAAFENADARGTALARRLRAGGLMIVDEAATTFGVENRALRGISAVGVPPGAIWVSALADVVVAAARPMVAADPRSTALLDMAARVARSEVTVFIHGPTGSGKEVLARQIHALSPRADKPFVAINCAAIPENMLEAVLFGHEKGAFTGAAAASAGLIRAAEGGTLLLDEISEMPMALQSKLLRVLQERRVMPLGSQKEIPVDIRILATTNRDMPAEIAARRFREDLYYRLNVFPLATAPLADRPDDIPALALALALKHAAPGRAPALPDEAALARLGEYHWPGNVRELENVIQRALVLCDGQVITPCDLMFDAPRPAVPAPRAGSLPLPALV